MFTINSTICCFVCGWRARCKLPPDQPTTNTEARSACPHMCLPPNAVHGSIGVSSGQYLNLLPQWSTTALIINIPTLCAPKWATMNKQLPPDQLPSSSLLFFRNQSSIEHKCKPPAACQLCPKTFPTHNCFNCQTRKKTLLWETLIYIW